MLLPPSSVDRTLEPEGQVNEQQKRGFVVAHLSKRLRLAKFTVRAVLAEPFGGHNAEITAYVWAQAKRIVCTVSLPLRSKFDKSVEWFIDNNPAIRDEFSTIVLDDPLKISFAVDPKRGEPLETTARIAMARIANYFRIGLPPERYKQIPVDVARDYMVRDELGWISEKDPLTAAFNDDLRKLRSS